MPSKFVKLNFSSFLPYDPPNRRDREDTIRIGLPIAWFGTPCWICKGRAKMEATCWGGAIFMIKSIFHCPSWMKSATLVLFNLLLTSLKWAKGPTPSQLSHQKNMYQSLSSNECEVPYCACYASYSSRQVIPMCPTSYSQIGSLIVLCYEEIPPQRSLGSKRPPLFVLESLANFNNYPNTNPSSS